MTKCVLVALTLIAIFAQFVLAQGVPPIVPIMPIGTVTPAGSLGPRHPLYPKPIPQSEHIEYLPLIVIDR